MARLIVGNSLKELPKLPNNSIDSIVTDPPYELGFMGKQWDASGIAYNVELWSHCLRVLKPGGHLLAFGGTRTYHRMVCAIEDAGFEIRDSIHWIYGSGFPKSMDVAKAIEKSFGGEPAPEARTWQGWGTALKPAHEPICLARKPLEGTVAQNVLSYDTGALNIGASRIEFVSDEDREESTTKNQHADFGTAPMTDNTTYGDWSMVQPKNYDPVGRWPANIILDGSDEVIQHFPRSKGGVYPAARGQAVNTSFASGQPTEGGMRTMGDDGSAARFFANLTFSEDDATSFIYCAKPNTKERNAGLDGLESKRHADRVKDDGVGGDNPRNRSNNAKKNFHPTVKPLALMRYLCRLVTPPGGTVLDPFAGSGTTLVAATLEGFDATGIEMTEDYADIINGRLAWAESQQPTLDL